MKIDTPKIALFSSATERLSLYKDILKENNIVLDANHSLEDTKSFLHLYDIVIFDISSKSEMQDLEFLEMDENKRIIFLTSFSIKNSKFTQYRYCFTLLKPIELKHFIRILNSFLLEIKKFNYIKSKKDILAHTIEDSPFRMAVYDLRGALQYANIKYLIANKIFQVDAPLYFDDMTRCTLVFEEIVAKLLKMESLTTESKQEENWFQSFFYFIENKNFVVHICIDITPTKNQIITLQREALFFNNTSEGLAIIDERGIILSINEAFCKITGYTIDEAINKPISILNSGLHTKDFYEHLWDMLKYHGRWQGEIWNRRKNSEVYPEWLSITASIDPITTKKTYLALFTDISSIKEADQKIKFYANHDALTGLLNKNQFENMLKHTIDSSIRNNKKFALFFIDIDYFKDINDTYGHNIGDMLLKTVASLFQKNLRKEDIVARIGGDEFSIIVENFKDEKDILTIANNLNNAIRQPIVIEGHSCEVSFSIGISLYPLHGSDKVSLIKNADSAMYEVKKNGRDGAMLYHHDMSKELARRVSLQTDLRNAIANNEIEAYFQPVVHMATNQVTGCEVLSRWTHFSKGFIAPDEFIAIAENNGTIGILDESIMKKVFSVAKDIIAASQNPNFIIALNVSSKEFFSENYVQKIASLANSFEINPANIELEITETYIMKNHEIAIEKMKELKKLGFKLAIDDFGTGYSSLNYLKLFPIDKLKIDKSFVLKINQNDKDEAIVKSIINLSKFFNLEVQAEGVENNETITLLSDLDCDFFQGYYYSKPLPYHFFLDFMKSFNEK
jgi:diguanylate cyclase (GGDEF)-like protein/PAS domain S-box-containing protein